jgi:hypothetical protein
MARRRSVAQRASRPLLQADRVIWRSSLFLRNLNYGFQLFLCLKMVNSGRRGRQTTSLITRSIALGEEFSRA